MVQLVIRQIQNGFLVVENQTRQSAPGQARTTEESVLYVATPVDLAVELLRRTNCRADVISPVDVKPLEAGQILVAITPMAD